MRSPAPVTICIPVYNGANFLAQSIASVLDQTMPDFRLVVCDNCSTDATPDIARSFRDPRVEYVCNERNLGLVGNFNRCLALADSPYICLWHHDDVMLPDNLRRKVAVLDSHPGVGFVHSNMVQINAAGHAISEHWSADSKRDYVEAGHVYFERLVRRVNLICCPSVVARRACYERVGVFTNVVTSATDWDMWLRIALEYDVACIGEPLIQYRWHGANASNDFRDVAGFREEWTVKTKALRAARGRIPHWDQLRREVITYQVDAALQRGYESVGRTKPAATLSYCGLACALSPAAMLRPTLWMLLARVVVGRRGGDLYRHMMPAGARARIARRFNQPIETQN